MKNLTQIRITGNLSRTVVRVPGKANYIYCTDADKQQEYQVWSDKGPDLAGLYVITDVNPHTGVEFVSSLVPSAYLDAYAAVMNHSPSHTWPNHDAPPIHLRQFLPLQPSVSGFVLTVRAGWFETTDGLVYFDPGTVDLTASKPTSGARYVLVSISAEGELTVTDGTVKTLFTLSISDIPALPVGHTRVCAVRLFAGQAAVWDVAGANTDLLDFRFTSGKGDMLKSVYDTNDDGVVDSAEKVDGVDTAGSNKYYGTNSSGTPGFHSLPSGGGGGIDPHEYYSSSTAETGSDEFDGASLDAAWVQQTVSGIAEWVQKRHVLSCKFSGQSNNDLAVMLKPITLSDGQCFETLIRIIPRAANNFVVGICVTDGVLATSKAFSVVNYLATSNTASTFIFNRGTLTNMSQLGTPITNIPRNMINEHRIRLVRESSTIFKGEMSTLDGAQWSSLGLATGDPQFTPTHAGVFVTSWSSPLETIASFEFFRKITL